MLLRKMVALMAVAASAPLLAEEAREVCSPDGKIAMKVSVGKSLFWAVRRNGEEILAPSPPGSGTRRKAGGPTRGTLRTDAVASIIRFTDFFTSRRSGATYTAMRRASRKKRPQTI